MLAWAFGPCAVAAAPPVIQWAAPPECPDQAEIAARTARLMGPQLEPNLTAQIGVSRTAAGYRARMQIATPSGAGTRELEDAQCDRLADEVALVLALSSPTPPPSRPAGPRWTVAAFGGAVLGPLPAPAAAARIGLGVEWARLRVELHVSYSLAQTKAFGDGVLSGQFQLASGGAQAGLPLHFGLLELAPNVGVELEHFEVHGEGGVSRRTGYATSWGPALGLQARLRVAGPWAVVLATEGTLLLLRPRFVFSDAGTLHRPALWALNAWLGVEIRL